jgi:hypothetical protein
MEVGAVFDDLAAPQADRAKLETASSEAKTTFLKRA